MQRGRVGNDTRALAILLMAALTTAMTGLTAVAQDPSRTGNATSPTAPSTKAAPPASTNPASPTTTAGPLDRRRYDPARRVPPYFGQIGLNVVQRDSIYKIRAKHQAKIDDLEKQIAATQSEMLNECEAVLNDTQRKLLDNLRRSAPTLPTPTTATADAKSTESPKSPQ